MSSNEWIKLTDDGLVRKQLIREGDGVTAKEGDRVSVQYIGTLENGTEFDNYRKKDHPFEFTIGQRVIRGFSIAVSSMRVGEISKFFIDSDYGYGKPGNGSNIPPDTHLLYEIELLEICVGPSKQMQAIRAAFEDCDKGTALFRAGQYQDALNMYCQGRLRLFFDAKDESDPQHYPPEFGQIKIRLNKNLAICYAKVNDWTQSLHYADEVLEFLPQDPKALLRKFEAHLQLGQLVEARKAFDLGMAVTRNDPCFNQHRKKLEDLEKEERVRQNQTFKKMVKKD